MLGKEEKLGRDTRPYHYIDYPATSKEAARAALFDLLRHYHRLLLLYLLLLHASWSGEPAEIRRSRSGTALWLATSVLWTSHALCGGTARGD